MALLMLSAILGLLALAIGALMLYLMGCFFFWDRPFDGNDDGEDIMMKILAGFGGTAGVAVGLLICAGLGHFLLRHLLLWRP